MSVVTPRTRGETPRTPPAARPSVSETRRFARRAVAASSRSARWREELTRATGLTRSGMILAAVVVASWLIGYTVGGRPLYLVAYGSALFLVVAYAIGRRPLPLSGDRSDTRPRMQEGEEVSIDVSLLASRRLSTFMLEDRVPPLLGQHARLAVASLEGGESVSHSYQLTCWRRGVYQLGPLFARWGDPFGLTQREMRLAEPVELLVHPATEPVQDRPLTRLWEDPPIRPPFSKPWPSGLEFYGMRKYQPGDDIRNIVWRVFARTGEVMVREAEQGITDKLVIVLDTHRRYHTSGVVSESFETAVRVAASLGVHHLREGYTVTVEGNARRITGPLRGARAQLALLDELARVSTEDASLTELIRRQIAELSRDAQFMVITPRLDAESASRLRLVIERGANVTVVAVLYDEEAAETLGTAASLGAQVVEIRPGTPLNLAFRREIGAGRR